MAHGHVILNGAKRSEESDVAAMGIPRCAPNDMEWRWERHKSRFCSDKTIAKPPRRRWARRVDRPLSLRKGTQCRGGSATRPASSQGYAGVDAGSATQPINLVLQWSRYS